MNRRTILQGIGAISSIGAVSGVAAGKQNQYKSHNTSEQLNKIGSQISFHPSQDRAAFISAAFEKGLELYVAENVQNGSDIPSQVYQITSDTVGGAYDPKWQSGNRITFQKNLSRYKLKIPRSYKVIEHKVEEENVVDVEHTLQNAEVVK